MAEPRLPIEGGATFSLTHRILRAAWQLVWIILCSWTPPSMWRWRRFLLVLFGADMHPLCDVRGTARVWYPRNLKMGKRSLIADHVICYNISMITLEDGAIVSQRSSLCTASHSIHQADFALVSEEIFIRQNAWVASEAFVGPGVEIGEFAVLGARGCAFKCIPKAEVHGGNPAKKIGNRTTAANPAETQPMFN